MKKTALLVPLLVFLLSPEHSLARTSKEMTVSAAISLKSAFEKIGTTFEAKTPGVRVIFNFGASGLLARQIERGAPVDVYASASPEEMNELSRNEMILEETRFDFARNKIVLVEPSHSRMKLMSVNDLKRREVKRVAVGNPLTVPAGRYARETLSYFGCWESIREKLIWAENVRQVLDYVARGEVDAGLVYDTDARMESKRVRIVLEAPLESHRPILYPIAVVRGTREETLARGFIDLVKSPETQRILIQYGFTPIQSSP